MLQSPSTRSACMNSEGLGWKSHRNSSFKPSSVTTCFTDACSAVAAGIGIGGGCKSILSACVWSTCACRGRWRFCLCMDCWFFTGSLHARPSQQPQTCHEFARLRPETGLSAAAIPECTAAGIPATPAAAVTGSTARLTLFATKRLRQQRSRRREDQRWKNWRWRER